MIDHSKPLADELARIGITSVTYVASLTNTEQHFNALIDALAPQGKLALIDDPETLDVVPLKAKSLSLHWEFMFTRSMFETDDMIAQHQLLTRVAALIDNHTIKTTLGEHYGAITAANLQKAHRQLETGRAPSARSCWRGFKMISLYRRAQGETRPNGRPAPGPCRRCSCRRDRSRATSTMPCFSCATRRTPSICARRGRDRDALDAHVAMPYFQASMAQMESLLAEPLRLDFLTPVGALAHRLTRGGENHAPPPRGFKKWAGSVRVIFSSTPRWTVM